MLAPKAQPRRLLPFGAMSLKSPVKRVETVMIRNGARNRGVDVFDQHVGVPEFSHGAGQSAGIILKLMEGLRL